MVYESFYLPKVAWKLDMFLKCCGLKIAKGEHVTVDGSLCLGLRGWVRVSKEAVMKKDAQGKYTIPSGTFRNRIAEWYVGKAKMERVEQSNEMPF
jgi:hypothetical protein